MQTQESERQRVLGHATDVAIRVGSLALLAAWCFSIVSPFLLPITWGVIIAIALHGPYELLRVSLGGRSGLAAGLLGLALVCAIVVPGVLVGGSLADDLESVAQAFRAGELQIPKPSERVAGWPVVGTRLYEFWQLASQNLQAALAVAGPHLSGVALWLLSTAAHFGIGILQFLFAIVIGSLLLAHSEAGSETGRSLATRLAGDQGPHLWDLVLATVRGVTRGILGVALIQAILSGLGLFLAGVPAAGLWTLVILVSGVVQLGTGPVMIPVSIWLFSSADTFTAVAFLVWTIVLAPLDNILKPLLMGRGLDVPVAVIFIGAIGGFASQGIIGLFVGAVVLVLGYELWREWLAATLNPAGAATSGGGAGGAPS